MIEQQGILLFGRTGYGKSSIANMLIQGDIYQNNNAFTISDGARGETLNIHTRCTEKYQVFDIVGLGEPLSHLVSHKNAVNKIRDYFSKCKVTLNHIFYVQKKVKITDDDKKMFKLFKEIFEWAEKNIVIIITNSKPEWIEKNLETISEDLGKYPIISVDFPFTDEDEVDIIAYIYRNKRAQSLQRLENKLLELRYKSIKLEVLSSTQMTERNVSKVVSIVPIVGSVYQLISSGVYYALEKPNNAKERLIDGTAGLALDIYYGYSSYWSE
ncbi:unnamed protein product [Rhizophagus irregularis]|uniref:G domain-containing protein n=1 Tax=Rhizophagus irregularis TaxID=588596 RepID=A0A2I1FV59_9GLOM|nr:hypothetical protein RhiirC2_189020 [Rhizophagus irregularis]PKY38246.1 hypothetical protein RhiirA4_507307 [Rhizophagus irregularis]CAB4385527.1 unnamed protein product [Rhizophagus irregularis]CAB4427415.1 unnamed protein product [Rhizophagus irregularis]CAB5350412.1 unnamed protein product [Rhizophagus irregularis]